MRRHFFHPLLLGLSLLVFSSLSLIARPLAYAQEAVIIHVAPDGAGDGSSWANAADLHDALTPGGLIDAPFGAEI